MKGTTFRNARVQCMNVCEIQNADECERQMKTKQKIIFF